MGWFVGPECVVCSARGAIVCESCWQSLDPPGTDGPRALFAYTGAGRDIVAALKFRGRRRLAPFLAGPLSTLTPAGLSLVTWAPTSLARRSARGFDQAELLAVALAKSIGVPAKSALARAPGDPQTGLSKTARHQGPTFVAVRPSLMNGAKVLVVDDVVTTGATLDGARSVLLHAGATEVFTVAVAKTAKLRPT